MFNNLFNKINQGISQHGFLYFLKIQTTEFYYKKSFRKLMVDYNVGEITAEILNKISTNKDSKLNRASPYYEIKKAFSFSGFNYSDISLLDIGCGFGKVLNLGMMLNFKEVIGIDLDNSAVEKAFTNCLQMQKAGYSCNYKITQADAASYLIPDGINLIYLFNPFGKKTMEDVVDNIIEYQHNYKKELYVIYSIPVHEDIFIAHKQVTKIYERLNGSKAKSEMAIFRIQ